MARTERRRWTWDRTGGTLDTSARDSGCDHWGCHGWKRPARRDERHRAKAAMRREPDTAITRGTVRAY